ncbi:MAG: hypothetical protein MUP85_14110 [Candidatus Lokiarchaeota archaeon]|nr:hypothetical protein [Candidatus Lokiarchaeota archaeon]
MGFLKKFSFLFSIIFAITGILLSFLANILLAGGNRITALDITSSVFYIITGILLVIYLILPERDE